MEIEQTYESIHGMLNPLQAFPDSLLSGNIVIVLQSKKSLKTREFGFQLYIYDSFT